MLDKCPMRGISCTRDKCINCQKGTDMTKVLLDDVDEILMTGKSDSYKIDIHDIIMNDNKFPTIAFDSVEDCNNLKWKEKDKS